MRISPPGASGEPYMEEGGNYFFFRDSMITISEIADAIISKIDVMGYSDPHSVDQYLYGLGRIGKKYYIPEVADRLMQEIK